MGVKLDILNDYDVIGLDFDKTLVGSPNSAKLIDYILNNREKTYYIITFRTHNKHLEIPKILKNLYKIDLLKENIVKNIINIDNISYNNYKLGKFLLETKQLYNNQHLIDNYKNWKGKVCKEIGVQIMVDDDVVIKKGLLNNGVKFLKFV